MVNQLKQFSKFCLDGKMEGQGTLSFDGKEYIGEFKNDKKHGFGELRWPDGQKYIGNWKNGKQDGKGKLFQTNGNVIEGIWVWANNHYYFFNNNSYFNKIL